MRAATKAPTKSMQSFLPGIQLDPGSRRPMYSQLRDEVKRLILNGTIPEESPMPSPRQISVEFGCSRHTVATAYESLVAEGILEARHGVGTFVARQIHNAPKDGTPVRDIRTHGLEASDFAYSLDNTILDRNEEDPLHVFGMPDTRSFPWAVWSRIFADIWSRPTRMLLESVSAYGYPGLRVSIAQYVHRTRGIRVDPSQIVVTSGTTQSLDLLLRCLTDAHDKVVIEDPGRRKAERLIRAMGLEVCPVAVDRGGLSVEALESMFSDAKAVLVTPSHHYPTGATLFLERRLKLLEWAEKTGGWILEDDYDGEIIVDDHPLLPIYSLGGSDRVIYMGTFSKSVTPQLRIGYIICQPALAQMLAKVRNHVDNYPSVSMQPVLARFIDEGHLDSHIRRMRRLYKERQTTFLSELTRSGSERVWIPESSPSLFQVIHLPGCRDANADKPLVDAARAAGIPSLALSSLYFASKPSAGVIVGTGKLDVPQIPNAVAKLVAAIEEQQFFATSDS